ncbi:MAG: PH domain-containing protein, partial [Thermoguttaceae bacterium]|nr:PH domain-containing protein [Thermoguttaceae bacterium]
MTKTNENPEARPKPWREGRPSFKAFYPELIWLTILTFACIAMALRCSCAKPKQDNPDAAPPPVKNAALGWETQAFAQDLSLDELPGPTADVPSEETSVVDGAVADVEDEGAKGTAEPLPVADVDAVDEPIVAKDDVAKEPEGKKKSGAAKYYFIWSAWLFLPAVAWAWRATHWFKTIYGIKFEIRTDEDNPKATTLLVHRGIFNRKTDSMHIAQIKDIQKTQNIWQKYFQGGVGTIRLYTNDLTDGILLMKNMEEPSNVFNALDELRRRYWALGGIGGLT